MGLWMRGRPLQPASLTLPVDDAGLAYLAGIIDGEGCVRRHADGWRVAVANTDTRLMAWLATIGGSVYTQVGEHKPVMNWIVSATLDVANLCEAVRPFSIIKRERLEAALFACRLRRDLPMAIDTAQGFLMAWPSAIAA